VKNEARAIAEWIAYQRVIGFDQVVVYDNGSTDKTTRILADICQRDPAVVYIAWPDLPQRLPQRDAYRHAVEHVGARWLAFFDTDEFLVLNDHASVNAYLDAAPANVTAIALNWLIFGSAGQTRADADLVISRFRYCGWSNHPKHHFCKSIVRRMAVSEVSVHTFTLSSGGYANSALEPITLLNDAKTRKINHRGAQLNHYLLKSWEEFEEKRRRGNASRRIDAPDKFTHRGHISKPPALLARFFPTQANRYWIDHDLNHIRDHRIASLEHAVREKLAAWGLSVPPSVSPPPQHGFAKRVVWKLLPWQGMRSFVMVLLGNAQSR
jgi:glycosyltransferase involved in cell wall biosynthesis